MHLTLKQNEKLRAEVRAIIASEHDGSITEFAHKIDRSQPSISDFLNRKSGASYETVRRISNYYKRTIDSLVGKHDEAPEHDVERDAAMQAAQLLRFDARSISRVLKEKAEIGKGKDRRWWFTHFAAEDAQTQAPSSRRAKTAR